MGSFDGSVWISLKFRSGNPLTPSFIYRIRQKDSDLVYKNPRYKSVWVHAAKRFGYATAEGLVHKLFPAYQKYKEKQKRKNVLLQQSRRLEENRQDLLNTQQDWGVIDLGDGHSFVARDKYGNRVAEALILYYESDKYHTFTEDIYIGNEKKMSVNINTKKWWHADLAPKVSFNSSKNVVMTRVQGRDFTRKELVSGGDMTFSISGLIVSNYDGKYPADEVRKFIKLMQYNGILDINFMTLNILGIRRVIVTEYALGESEYKNEQPYRMSCVAVEPDEDIKIVKDTIETINEDLKNSPQNKWLNMILDNKLAQITTDNAVNLAIDQLISKI